MVRRWFRRSEEDISENDSAYSKEANSGSSTAMTTASAMLMNHSAITPPAPTSFFGWGGGGAVVSPAFAEEDMMPAVVPGSIMDALYALMGDEQLSDLTMKGSDGGTVFAVKAILATRSPVFRSMFFAASRGPGSSFEEEDDISRSDELLPALSDIENEAEAGVGFEKLNSYRSRPFLSKSLSERKFTSTTLSLKSVSPSPSYDQMTFDDNEGYMGISKANPLSSKPISPVSVTQSMSTDSMTFDDNDGVGFMGIGKVDSYPSYTRKSTPPRTLTKALSSRTVTSNNLTSKPISPVSNTQSTSTDETDPISIDGSDDELLNGLRKISEADGNSASSDTNNSDDINLSYEDADLSVSKTLDGDDDSSDTFPPKTSQDSSSTMLVEFDEWDSRVLFLLVEYCYTDNLAIITVRPSDEIARLMASLRSAAKSFQIDTLLARIDAWSGRNLDRYPSLFCAMIDEGMRLDDIDVHAMDALVNRTGEALLPLTDQVGSGVLALSKPGLLYVFRYLEKKTSELVLFDALMRWVEFSTDGYFYNDPVRERASKTAFATKCATRFINVSNIGPARIDEVMASGFFGPREKRVEVKKAIVKKKPFVDYYYSEIMGD